VPPHGRVTDLEGEDVESTLAFTAAAWAIAMALGPVLQIRRIVDERSSRGVSISYFIVLLIGFGLWIAYGVAAANLALIVPNVIAADCHGVNDRGGGSISVTGNVNPPRLRASKPTASTRCDSP
jgi:MtN3 and saliva related transmembrane protein